MSAQLVLSICVPVYNEEENLPLLHAAVAKVLDANSIDGELILVDDGSKDGSWKAIEALVAKDPRVRGLKFAFNCGETAASDQRCGLARGARAICHDHGCRSAK
jgi:glycosyltransferase involved in cell wall biosynthesis